MYDSVSVNDQSHSQLYGTRKNIWKGKINPRKDLTKSYNYYRIDIVYSN